MAPETDVTRTAAANGARDAQMPPARIGRYVIEGTLGAGGMGIVYAGYDADLDRRVAIKVLRRSTTAESEARVRLLREARAMAKLPHPNVITVHEVGTDGGTDFVAMELIDGSNVVEWRAETRPSRAEILRVFHAAGQGLAAAHEAGLVHRDFKPHNVLVGRDGRVVVTDFGLARAAAEAGTERAVMASDSLASGSGSQRQADAADAPPIPVSGLADTIDAVDSGSSLAEVCDRGRDLGSWTDELTRTGAVLGTPAYMSPEQHAGRSADPRGDQFSFCVALWEALTGERPLRGATLEELCRAARAGVPPEAGRELPHRFRAVLLRGLEVDPARRWSSMKALLTALSAAESRPRWFAMAAALVAGALVIAAVAGLWPKPVTAVCALPASAIDVAWSPARRAAMPAAVAAMAAPAFDRARTAWLDARSVACAAPASPVQPGRLACLRDAGDRLSALVAEVAAAPASRVQAADVPGMVPEPDVCAAETPPGTPAPPADPSVLARQRRAIAAFALATRGYELDDLDRRIAQLVDGARASGACAAHAEALIAAARVLALVSDEAASRERAEAASIVAERCGDDHSAAAAAILLLDRAIDSRQSGDEIARLLERARAIVDRAGDPPSLAGELALAASRIDGDVATLERARDRLAAAGRAVDAAGLELIAASRPVTLGAGGDPAEVERRARAVVSLFEEHFGAGHPRSAMARVLTAWMAWFHDADAFEALRAQARAYWLSPEGQRRIAAQRGAPALSLVTGTVVDAAGRPVAGATVAAAPLLLADNRHVAAFDFGLGPNGPTGAAAEVTTDTTGAFTLQARPGSMIIADSAGLRSRPTVAASPAVLRLAPAGRIHGRVTHGAGTPMLTVGAMAEVRPTGPFYLQLVPVDASGTFTLDHVPPGHYQVTVHVGAGRQSRMAGREVDIAGTEIGPLELALEEGTATLDVVIRSSRGIIEAAQIIVVRSRIVAQTFAELASQLRVTTDDHSVMVENADAEAQRRGRELGGDLWARIEGLAPGLRSVCVVPLTQESSNRWGSRAHHTMLAENAGQVDVTCRQVDVTGAPGQSVIIDAAPMKRLRH